MAMEQLDVEEFEARGRPLPLREPRPGHGQLIEARRDKGDVSNGLDAYFATAGASEGAPRFVVTRLGK